MLGNFFDKHSNGRFAATLLGFMLVVATIVQPFSLIYTAYNGHHAEIHNLLDLWQFTPGLAVLLFVALDWTVLPVAYFFTTTNKPSLKFVLGIMLVVIACGAFDGYFVAAERFIAMRLDEITKFTIDVEAAEANVTAAKAAQAEARDQQVHDRENQDKLRADLAAKMERIDKQVAEVLEAQKADVAQHLALLDQVLKTGRTTAQGDGFIRKNTEAENQRHAGVQAGFAKKLDELAQEKAGLTKENTGLNADDAKKVDAANAKVEAAEAELDKVGKAKDVAALNNQVYRWASVLFHKSARKVTADEANSILMIFAAMVAAGYVVAQVMIAISYYGRERKGMLEAAGTSLSEQASRAVRKYYARKRKPIVRTVAKEVHVPVAERTKIIYVPVAPGVHVPKPEEIVTKPLPPVVAEEPKAVEPPPGPANDVKPEAVTLVAAE